jgi:hypothetical protein
VIKKIFKALLRTSVAQPWEYMGEGAPNEWEFRLHPDQETLALYSPLQGHWTIFRDVVVLAEVTSLKEMDRNTGDWARFVEELDPDDWEGINAESRARGWTD